MNYGLLLYVSGTFARFAFGMFERSAWYCTLIVFVRVSVRAKKGYDALIPISSSCNITPVYGW